MQTLNSLPPDLQPHNIASKSNDNCYAFFTGLSPLSNFYECQIVVDGIRCNSVEQYFQLMKAKCAKDELSEARIAGATTPLQCKQIGDKIKMNRNVWDQEKDNVMKQALYCKFTQNRLPRDTLFQTGTKTLAEANGRDLYWGTGSSLGHVNVLKSDLWKGKNCLGLMLMDLRQHLLNN
jgi:ribA/ribD-fused uncharacterized protein